MLRVRVTRESAKAHRGKLAVLVGAAGVALAVLGAFALGLKPPAGPRFPPTGEALLEPFMSEAPPSQAYENLFRYFLTGFLSYSQPHRALAYYPGLPSTHGKRVDAMEGFTRFAPLAAAWVHSGRPSRIELTRGETVDLVALIRQGLLNGTDMKSPGYWGQIGDYDQRIAEAADVALTIWLTRDNLWNGLKPSEQEQIGRWVSRAVTRHVPDNNWHLFPAFISLVLRDLGDSVDLTPARQHYARLKTFYRGEGWFSDGPRKVYDYYNAWAIHYQLYWMSQVDANWDAAFIESSRREFLKSYTHLIGRGGVPIRGRSICYRMATPAPLVFDYASGSRGTKPGEALRALDLTWAYFIRRGAVREGTVTQGYCGPDERLLDNYAGPASCLWSLRSLIPAFAIPAQDRFWAGPPDSLPIDRESYRLRVSSVGWTIAGDAETGITSITADDSLPDSLIQIHSSRAWTALKARLTGRPNRARNRMAKYQGGTYYSEPAFCGCPQQVGPR